MSRQNDIWSLDTGRIVIGTSAGFYVGITAGAGVQTGVLKYVSGGTLEIFGTTTQAGLSQTTGYLFGASEIMSIQGPAVYYLACTGATTTVCFLKGKTAGT